MTHLTDKQRREHIAALPDAVALAMGLKPANAHPLAQMTNLRALVERTAPENARGGAGVATAAASSDFRDAIARAGLPSTLAVFDETAEHRAFCSIVPAPDFRPFEILALDSDVSLEQVGETGHIPTSTLHTHGAITGQVNTFGRILGLTRQSIINGDLSPILRGLQNGAATAARLEARLIAGLLESNPAMADGAAVFDAEHQNVHAQAFDGTALGAVIALLRNQKTSAGHPSGLSAKHLVVEPNLEFTARKTVHEAGLQIQVHALAGLAAGRWFLLASPIASPVVGLLQLDGQKTPIRVEALRYNFSNDALPVRLTADLGVTWLRRVGVVKGGV